MLLNEHMTFGQAGIIRESDDSKNLYLKGCFIQGDVRNHNGRIYPLKEISSAVTKMTDKISKGLPILGECDHPSELTISLKNVSHAITEIRLEGADGIGKMKILDTEYGRLAKTLIEAGIPLGVSSRGQGNVDGNGYVSDFEIVTIDLVATPSAPDAYPRAIYEAYGFKNGGDKVGTLVEAVRHDPKAQKYLQKGIVEWFKSL